MRKFAAILAVLSWVIIGCEDEGKKVEACKEGLIKCGSTCIDPNTNKDYCGARACCLGSNAGVTCAADQTCSAGKCVGGGGETCTADLCSNGKIRVCTDGKPGAETACAGGADCKSATACGECKNDTLDCDDTKIKTCENGVWKEGADCKADGKICFAGACAAAAPCETNVCTDGKIQVCTDGMLGSAATCAGGADCKSASECGECVDDNAIVCTGESTYKMCVAGVWVDEGDCRYPSGLCLEGVGCVECRTVGETGCTDSEMSQVCTPDHKWDPLELCEDGAVCIDGECISA